MILAHLEQTIRLRPFAPLSNAQLQLRASAPVSCKLLLDQRRRLQCHSHESDGSRKILHDDLSRDAKHVVAEAREIPIAPRIRSALPRVDAAIHFHDQPQRGREEVRDVPATAHHLPAKGNTEATTAELPPKRALRFLREEPHVPSAIGEDVLASWRDCARRLEHDE